MTPQISVVVCTHNRADSLVKTLSSLCHQSIRKECYEILVVDNASTDQTGATIGTFIAHNPEYIIRSIVETHLGLSFARNAGLQNATASIVAYIDDDAEAGEIWLETIVKVMQADPEIWSAGGKVLPIWDAPRPDWLKDDLLNAVSLLDRGDQERILEWPDRLIGTNISFQRHALEAAGGFDPLLGRQGSLLSSEEETDLQQCIYQMGGKILYSPSAVVYHHVSPERLTKHYFCSRSYGTGQSRAIVAGRNCGVLKKILLLLWTTAGFIYYGLRTIISLEREKRFRNLRTTYGKWGFIRQMMKTRQ